VTISIVSPDATEATTTSTRRMLDAKAVGARLGCSWRTVLRLADRGAMPPGVKLGALRRWDAEQIEKWICADCKPVRQIGRA
jgi:predicted DNA-binding transcriptional regulator AlpA